MLASSISYCIYFILLLMLMMMIDWSIMNAMALESSSLVLSIIDAPRGVQYGGGGFGGGSARPRTRGGVGGEACSPDDKMSARCAQLFYAVSVNDFFCNYTKMLHVVAEKFGIAIQRCTSMKMV